MFTFWRPSWICEKALKFIFYGFSIYDVGALWLPFLKFSACLQLFWVPQYKYYNALRLHGPFEYEMILPRIIGWCMENRWWTY